MICRVTLKDKMESEVIALRMGVDDLEEHLRQKRLRRFRHTVRRDEKVEIKASDGVENSRTKKERQASEMMD